MIRARWELGPNHEIRYRSDKKDEQFTFKSSILAAESEALVLSLTEKQSDQKTVTRIVRLAGAWRLDPKNRIVFEAEKKGGQTGTLIFTGTWQVGQGQEVLYTYDTTDLKTKKKTFRTLAFSGYWDISKDRRLVYRLSGDTGSSFAFRGAFQTKSILAKKGEIRYQAGAEVNGKHRIKEIVLFGKWKFSRDFGLSFEIEYEGGRRKAIRFGGEYTLGKDSRIAASLKSREGDPLGIEVIFTKDFFGKDGRAFVRLRRSVEESAAEAGLHFKW
jgi:hypothetical protein